MSTAAPPLRVLIVDDDPGARMLHSRYVAGAPGFVVTATVGTGRAAVQHGLRGDVDLVLLDMRLPDISGIEVLNRLRTLHEASPDVLVISSSRDQVTVRQALAAHVVGYLVKPFTEEALQARLAAYRSERRTDAGGARELALAQGEIDRLQSTGRITLPSPAEIDRGRAAPSLPKGISEVTLESVLEVLDPVTPISAVELAAQCQISRPTARRYLDYLVDIGAIDLAHRYGKRGRPEVLYRLVPAPPEG